MSFIEIDSNTPMAETAGDLAYSAMSETLTAFRSAVYALARDKSDSHYLGQAVFDLQNGLANLNLFLRNDQIRRYEAEVQAERDRVIVSDQTEPGR